MKLNTRRDYRVRRHQRIRKRIRGTGAKPRMAIFKSNTSLYVQFVDDDRGVTLGAVRSNGAKSVAAAEELGKRAAELAQANGIRQVVIDRGGFPFHGRVRAVVDAAVTAGLSIGAQAPAAEAEPVADATTEET